MTNTKTPVVHAYRIQEGTGWSRAWKVAAGLGVLGLLGMLLGYSQGSQRLAFSFLFAFCAVLPIGLGCLFFVILQHLTGAHWSVTVRRIAECFAKGLSVFAMLVLPLLWFSPTLYPWMQAHTPTLHPQTEQAEHAGVAHEEPSSPVAREGDKLHALLEEAEAEEHAHVLEGKRPFLNKGFFSARALVYVIVWSLLGTRFFSWSVEQDRTKSLENTVRAQRLAPVATVLFGLTVTLAGIDWLMTLDPVWFSTMWGVYFFATSLVAAFATLILTTLALKRAGLLGNAIHLEHFHDLGKLQFGFLVFWAYIAFSQFFLIWYASLPEETTFFSLRWNAGEGVWKGVSCALLFGHFFAPFVLLLSRHGKRNLGSLALGACLLLVMHVVELYWIVMPHHTVQSSAWHWMDLACLLFVGGSYLAVVLHAMASHDLIPTGDPRLARSLQHEG